MSEFSSLPTGCILRPARAEDREEIRWLLKSLERELSPNKSAAPWLAWILLLSLAAWFSVQGANSSGFRLLMQILFSAVGVGAIVILATIFISIQYDWTHYWVIEHQGNLLACAKLQRQNGYSVLFDLYVIPDWRGQGLGSHLVSYLGQRATKPLYLACLPARLPFYQRLGFSQVAAKRLPLLLQYDLGLPTRPGIVPLIMT